METVTLKVDGMKCDGCAAAVRAALERVEGVSSVDVSLSDASVSVRAERPLEGDVLREAIVEAGYSVG